MSFADLEQRVDRALRRLPAPHAPQSLLPRILAAVDGWARRPWYTRAWLTWPMGWQAASVAAAIALAYGAWILPPLPSSVTGTTSAGGVVWRTLVEPFLAYVSGIVLLMCIACAAFGAALHHVLLERTASR